MVAILEISFAGQILIGRRVPALPVVRESLSCLLWRARPQSPGPSVRPQNFWDAVGPSPAMSDTAVLVLKWNVTAILQTTFHLQPLTL